LPVEAEQASGLDVTLSQVSDTRIKAVVKNTGNEDVTFVHLNFFRDSAPVKKVAVYKDGMPDSRSIFRFRGVLIYL
jgi:deuterolysin